MKYSTALARNFREGMRDRLTAEQLVAIDATNRERNDNTCATHDYCDANEVMIEAFFMTFGRENDASSDWDTDLINEAWDEAKAHGFSKEG